MQTLADIISKQQRFSRSDDDVLVSQIMARLIQAAEEVCVQRDRVDTCLKIAEAGQSLTLSSIDQYEPSPEEVASRLDRHTRYFESLFTDIGEANESP